MSVNNTPIASSCRSHPMMSLPRVADRHRCSGFTHQFGRAAVRQLDRQDREGFARSIDALLFAGDGRREQGGIENSPRCERCARGCVAGLTSARDGAPRRIQAAADSSGGSAWLTVMPCRSAPGPLVSDRVHADIQAARHVDGEMRLETAADSVERAPDAFVLPFFCDLGQDGAGDALVFIPADEIGLAHALRESQ